MQMQIDSESSLLVEISVVGCIRILRVVPIGLDMVGHELVFERVTVDAGEMELHFEPVFIFSSGAGHVEMVTSFDRKGIVLKDYSTKLVDVYVSVVECGRIDNHKRPSIDQEGVAIVSDSRVVAKNELRVQEVERTGHYGCHSRLGDD